jgi:hypothetical protein
MRHLIEKAMQLVEESNRVTEKAINTLKTNAETVQMMVDELVHGSVDEYALAKSSTVLNEEEQARFDQMAEENEQFIQTSAIANEMINAINKSGECSVGYVDIPDGINPMDVIKIVQKKMELNTDIKPPKTINGVIQDEHLNVKVK